MIAIIFERLHKILSRTEIDVRDSLKFALSVFVIYRRKPCNQREPLEITISYDLLKRFFRKTHQITLVLFINIHFQNTSILLCIRIFTFAGGWMVNKLPFDLP